jgi:Flp pilus assembly protein TadG
MSGKAGQAQILDERGAAAVEFAIILPLLVVLVFGIIEFSFLLYDKAMITNASREGARAGIVFRWDIPSDSYNPLDQAEIEAVVNQYLGSRLITFSSDAATTTVTDADTTGNGFFGSGDYREVRVEYRYTFLVFPDVLFLLGGSSGAFLDLEANTRMRME